MVKHSRESCQDGGGGQQVVNVAESHKVNIDKCPLIGFK